MVTAIKSYQIDNKMIEVDLEQIPTLPPEFLYIFKGSLNVPELIQKKPTLQHKITSVAEITTTLQKTKDNDIKNKIIAFLKTALIITFLAGCIAACVFGGPIGAGLGLTGAIIGFFILSSIFYYNSNVTIYKIESQIPGYSRPWYFPERRRHVEIQPDTILAMFGGGLVMPLFEAFTRESRIERLLQHKEKALQETLSWYEEQLPKAYRFYKEHSEQLLNRLNDEINSRETSLALRKQNPERPQVKEAELEALISNYQNNKNAHLQIEIAHYQKVKKALQEVLEFYRKLDATVLS